MCKQYDFPLGLSVPPTKRSHFPPPPATIPPPATVPPPSITAPTRTIHSKKPVATRQCAPERAPEHVLSLTCTMSSSPAWLTIALTSLASCATPTPSIVLSSGIRTLPTPHILHHLNRWARHVWRPAVTSRALANLTRDPASAQLSALGSGAVSLLSALVEAVERCEAQEWVGVLGVMFLADDPWAVEVGRAGHGKDVDRAVAAMKMLYEEKRGVLAEVASKMSLDVRDVADDIDGDGSFHGESFAELRCRVAALQLQLDDVTAVVRRNEKNTKDLLSSFHFWSLLLLDELRSYKAQLGERNLGHPSWSMGKLGDEVLEGFAKNVAVVADRVGGSGGGSERSLGMESLSNASGGGGNGGKEGRVDGVRPKRVFRDGKWVVL